MLASSISTKMAEKLKSMTETHRFALKELVLIQGWIILCLLPGVNEMPVPLLMTTHDIAEEGWMWRFLRECMWKSRWDWGNCFVNTVNRKVEVFNCIKNQEELITLFKFFTRQEEKGNKGFRNGRFANFTKGFNSRDGLVLNKLIFMSAMKAFYFSNSFSQLTFRPNYFNVLYVSLILKTTCTLEFL